MPSPADGALETTSCTAVTGSCSTLTDPIWRLFQSGSSTIRTVGISSRLTALPAPRPAWLRSIDRSSTDEPGQAQAQDTRPGQSQLQQPAGGSATGEVAGRMPVSPSPTGSGAPVTGLSSAGLSRRSWPASVVGEPNSHRQQR